MDNPTQTIKGETETPCRFGLGCRLVKKNECKTLTHYYHEDQNIPDYARKIQCGFGRKCVNIESEKCIFAHPQEKKICRYGNKCRYLATDSCKFYHHKKEDNIRE